MKQLLIFLTYWVGLLLCPIMMSASRNDATSFDVQPAESADTLHTKSFFIHYRPGHTDIDTLYLDNASQVEQMRNCLRNSQSIDSIKIHAWASPEGSYGYNFWLSDKRVETAKDFILAQVPDGYRLSEEQILVTPLGENWSGLLKAVEERYDLMNRDKVLKILRNSNISDETRKWRLKNLDNGYTWNYLIKNFMSPLRSATMVYIWMGSELPSLDKLASIEDSPIEACSDIASILPSPLQKKQISKDGFRLSHRERFYIRTNLLAPLSNIGAGYCINDNWSIGADYYFPWIWPSKKNKNCFELLGWSIEGRYWFGKNRGPYDRLRGHSLGLYGAGGYYDFERNYTGQQGEFASTGLDYAYAMPVGKKKRIILEFSLSVGYIHAWARNYHVPEEYGPLFREDGDIRFDYFGPTKAAVNIVVPFHVKEGRR